jgi:hypothetical protein
MLGMNMEKKKIEKQKKKVEVHWQKIEAEEFRQVDEIVRDQTGLPNKQIHLQKMEFKSDGRTEYRLCYYMRKNTSSVWRFQRFTAFVPKADFEAILKEAHTRGWF